jgi:hypothetical protein
MRYTVDENFAIRIFGDGEDVPFQFQPTYPNGDSFDSIAEANAWAEASIAAHNPAITHFAPSGKSAAPAPKLTPLMVMKASAKAALVAGRPLTPEEAETLVP